MKIFFYVTGVFLALAGLLLLVATPVVGCLSIAGGIVSIIYGKKYEKEKQASLAADDAIRVQLLKQEQTHEEYMRVAGFDHFQDALASLLTEENFLYSLSKHELLDEYDVDPVEDKVYQFEKLESDVHFIPEPDNEFDPQAVKVIVDGVHIGYVPRGRFPQIIEYASKPGASCHAVVYGGNYKYFEYDDEADITGSFDNKYLSLQSDFSPYKASLTFIWENSPES